MVNLALLTHIIPHLWEAQTQATLRTQPGRVGGTQSEGSDHNPIRHFAQIQSKEADSLDQRPFVPYTKRL